jgi:hypothetical protein
LKAYVDKGAAPCLLYDFTFRRICERILSPDRMIFIRVQIFNAVNLNLHPTFLVDDIREKSIFIAKPESDHGPPQALKKLNFFTRQSPD